MDHFITVAIFNSHTEIVVLKSVLENKKIVHFFENENLISIQPFASYAYGGIKLKIHPNDSEIVQEILDNLNNNLKIV